MEECYFSKVAGPATLLKVTLLHRCFSRYLNCANGNKSRKTSHICIGYAFGNNFHLLEKHHLEIRQKSIMKWQALKLQQQLNQLL